MSLDDENWRSWRSWKREQTGAKFERTDGGWKRIERPDARRAPGERIYWSPITRAIFAASLVLILLRALEYFRG